MQIHKCQHVPTNQLLQLKNSSLFHLACCVSSERSLCRCLCVGETDPCKAPIEITLSINCLPACMRVTILDVLNEFSWNIILKHLWQLWSYFNFSFDKNFNNHFTWSTCCCTHFKYNLVNIYWNEKRFKWKSYRGMKHN